MDLLRVPIKRDQKVESPRFGGMHQRQGRFDPVNRGFSGISSIKPVQPDKVNKSLQDTSAISFNPRQSNMAQGVSRLSTSMANQQPSFTSSENISVLDHYQRMLEVSNQEKTHCLKLLHDKDTFVQSIL